MPQISVSLGAVRESKFAEGRQKKWEDAEKNRNPGRDIKPPFLKHPFVAA